MSLQKSLYNPLESLPLNRAIPCKRRAVATRGSNCCATIMIEDCFDRDARKSTCKFTFITHKNRNRPLCNVDNGVNSK